MLHKSLITWTNKHNYFLILFLTLVNCEPVVLGDTLYSPHDAQRTTITSQAQRQCQDLTLSVHSVDGGSSGLPSPARAYRNGEVSGSSRNEFIFQFSSGQTKALTSDFEILWSAPQPIEFTYAGPADEEMGLMAVSERLNENCYTLKLMRKRNLPLNSKDTGLYTGRYISNPEKKVSVYLFVPNRYPPYLLNTERLVTVNWREGKPLVLPCILNDPSVQVTLSKRKGLNEWQEVSSTVGAYNPQSGFLIKKPFNGGTSLFGSYKCFTKLHNRNDTVFLNVIPA